jgi:hypothetical protein
MAIGDTPNQNLFGTNYNAEEEERKKAELAAQGAMMGASVPASAFGQAPAVNPFSMEAAGQVNPMMQAQSLPTENVSNLITNNPFISTGGAPTTAQPNVNFNAISMADATNPAFEGMSAGEIINEFNEPGYTTPPLVEQTFSERPKSRFRGFVDPIIDEFTSAGQDAVSAAKVGYQFFSDPSRPTLQSLTEQEKQNRSAGLADLQARNEESIRRGEAFLSQDGTTQAPSGASALGATPSVTPPVETPSEGAQAQTAALDPTSDEAILANRAQREAQFAPAGGLTTVGGASLSEFLSGQAMPEQGFTQEESPLGGRGVTLTPDQMNELSAQREARLDARLPGDQAVSDRERRAARGDGISMADQTAMAKANARDATPREVARGNQVANALGVDLKTGQPPETTGGLTETERLNREKFLYQQGQDILAGKVLNQEAATARTEAFETSRNNVRSTQDSYEKLKPVAEEIANLSGSKFTEGMLGWTASKLPFSTDAAQIERLTTEFEGSAFLQGLIDAKSKGATFGALSEREGDRILGQWGKITSPKSTNKERISAINSMLGSIQRAAERAQSDHRERFPELFNQTNPSSVQGTGQRYNNDQDHGAAVETHFVG